MSQPARDGIRCEDPGKVYVERRSARKAEAAKFDRRHVLLGYTRLATAGAGIALAWMILDGELLSGWALLAPLALFLVLSYLHDRVIHSRDRFQRAAGYYDEGIGRLEGRWAGSGEPGEEFRDPQHPYAEDLDLFGRGSLFELLCAARTRAGRQTLARWLLEPAGTPEVLSRQEAVAELRGRIDLREDLALLSAEARSGVDSRRLANWAAAVPVLTSSAIRVTALLLSVLTVTTLGGWLLFAWSSLPLALLLAIQAILGYRFRERVSQVIAGVDGAAKDLATLSQVLGRLEGERFSSNRLAKLRSALDIGGDSPSVRTAHLNRLVELLDSRRNQIFAPVSPLILWTTQMAFAIEAWRIRSGAAVAEWLEAVGELEALSSLAGHAFEHPEDPFPELVEDGPRFQGEAVGHPLLPGESCVRNDLRLGPDRRLLVVSGSNMSGKSTLLRSVGVNVVLAMSGAPVRAGRLSLSRLVLGASIRNVDSLQDGRSRFFAEITRLGQIMTLAGDGGPLLYLLDELLSGTNSHDRKIGAEAVVQGLVRRGAVGLLTTHDLALTRIADELGQAGANVHFEDRVQDGEICFDYRLRPGVVKKGNALVLMRSVGLEI
jgi:hypothetical protein